MIPAVTQSLIQPFLARDLPQEAERPRWTPLQCLVSAELGLSPFRNWRASLAEYIQNVFSAPASSENC